MPDLVGGQADLKAPPRRRMPGRHGWVGPIGTAGIAPAPRTPEHDRREGLTRVGQELEFRADVDDRDRRTEDKRARRLALSENSGEEGGLEQVVLERHVEAVAAQANRTGGQGRTRARGGYDRIGQRGPGGLSLVEGRSADRRDRLRVLDRTVVPDEEHGHTSDGGLE